MARRRVFLAGPYRHQWLFHRYRARQSRSRIRLPGVSRAADEGVFPVGHRRTCTPSHTAGTGSRAFRRGTVAPSRPGRTVRLARRGRRRNRGLAWLVLVAAVGERSPSGAGQRRKASSVSSIPPGSNWIWSYPDRRVRRPDQGRRHSLSAALSPGTRRRHHRFGNGPSSERFSGRPWLTQGASVSKSSSGQMAGWPLPWNVGSTGEESPGSMGIRCRVTPGEGDLRESAAESKPPTRRRARVRVKGCGKSAPRCR